MGKRESSGEMNGNVRYGKQNKRCNSSELDVKAQQGPTTHSTNSMTCNNKNNPHLAHLDVLLDSLNLAGAVLGLLGALLHQIPDGAQLVDLAGVLLLGGVEALAVQPVLRGSQQALQLVLLGGGAV